MTGIGFCAWAATGHAATIPMPTMNSPVACIPLKDHAFGRGNLAHLLKGLCGN